MIILGINSSGLIHYGNYISLIKPTLKIIKKKIFIADLHCFSKVKNFKNICINKFLINLTFLSFYKVNSYYQSYNKSIIYLYWVLSCFFKINKTKLFHNIKNKKIISIAKICYPILMCTDIFINKINYIFIGIDQIQHIEIMNFIKKKINYYLNFNFINSFNFIVNNIILYSYDKKKMSKSNKNDIFIFSKKNIILNFFNKFKLTLKRKKSIINYLFIIKNINYIKIFKINYKKIFKFITEEIYNYYNKYRFFFLKKLKNKFYNFKNIYINNVFCKNIIFNNLLNFKNIINI